MFSSSLSRFNKLQGNSKDLIIKKIFKENKIEESDQIKNKNNDNK